MRLQEARKANGMTQQELKLRLGVDQSLISHWEGGRQAPSPTHQKTMDKIFTPHHVDWREEFTPLDEGEQQAAVRLVRDIFKSGGKEWAKEAMQFIYHTPLYDLRRALRQGGYLPKR